MNSNLSYLLMLGGSEPTMRELIDIVEKAADLQQNWNAVAGWDNLPDARQTRLESAFPNLGELLNLLSDNNGEFMDVAIEDADTVRFSIRSGSPILDLKRALLMNENILHLENIEISEENQHGNIARRILKGTVEAAKRLGVRHLQLEAAKVGAWLWAKAGFVPYSEGSVNLPTITRIIRDRFTNMKPTDAMRRDWLPKIENIATDPASIYDIAIRTDVFPKMHKDWASYGGDVVAKEILINSHWYGKLDLNDSLSMQRLDEFLAGI